MTIVSLSPLSFVLSFHDLPACLPACLPFKKKKDGVKNTLVSPASLSAAWS
jgi:hypothetical protein